MLIAAVKLMSTIKGNQLNLRLARLANNIGGKKKAITFHRERNGNNVSTKVDQNSSIPRTFGNGAVEMTTKKIARRNSFYTSTSKDSIAISHMKS